MRYSNQIPFHKKRASDILRWLVTRKANAWAYHNQQTSYPSPPKKVEGSFARVTFVNHATVLIQIDGLNILTDPIWSQRCSPISFMGPKRACKPGDRFEELPHIDAVLISHNHYDHLDLPTLRKLNESFRPKFFVPLGNSALLKKSEISSAQDMDWWQSELLSSQVEITCVPAQHWSSRTPFDQMQTLWSGFVVKGATQKIYFAGDTALGPHFLQIRDKFGPVDLALLPVGAYLPRWFMQESHISPGEAIAAAHELEARLSVAIHFGTFKLGDDGQFEAVDELQKILKETNDPLKFQVLDFGEHVILGG